MKAAHQLLLFGTLALSACSDSAGVVQAADSSSAGASPGAAQPALGRALADQPLEATAAGPAPGSRWPLQVELPEHIEAAYDRVVLVSIDTLRADHVSAYGYPRPTTPFIDTLAERGVLFEQAVASVTHTAPSHASMLTGLPPVAHGVLLNGDTLEPDALDLGKVFGMAGYDTGAFLNTNFLRSVATSFDEKQTFHVTREVIDAALGWLDDAERSERFFMLLHTYEPHRWTNPSNFSEQDVAAIQAGTELDDTQLYDYLAATMGLPNPPAGEPFPELWNSKVVAWLREIKSRRDYLDAIDGYDSLILHADQQIERLYRGFEERGLAGRTLWIITSDHGEGIGSHGIVGHGGHMFQEQLRVPLIFHAMDDSLGPRRVPDLVQHVDLFPTLVASLGASSGGIDPMRAGSSLLPLLRGTGSLAPRSAFAQRRPQVVTEKELTTFSQRRPRKELPEASLELEDERSWNAIWTLQTLEAKYILRRSGKNSFYDLAKDPLELDNLIGKGGTVEAELAREIEERVRLYLAIRREAYAEAGIEPEVIDELRALGYVE